MAETRTPKQIAADKVDELIERLEKADGPSRELDVQIWLATSPGVTRSTQCVVSATGAWPPYDIDETRDETGRLIIVPAYTASLDAAFALAERVLTRLDLLEITYQIGGPKQHCTVETEDGEFDGINRPTLPLAICLATLKAVRVHMHPRDREEANQ